MEMLLRCDGVARLDICFVTCARLMASPAFVDVDADIDTIRASHFGRLVTMSLPVLERKHACERCVCVRSGCLQVGNT